ncbi:Ras-like protein gene family, member A [Nematocida homosporus]|uniref:Ras-like protein gene family, member A n=1 Tax=Nematocida homosporus TaxID=1912981 RepID=UPI00221E9A91|nr:Ras-like protein gene family, member A [Nematocida homosporus]KAI5186364.1 Ras-like protein gene family, member A [Nematocida homosporus]
MAEKKEMHRAKVVVIGDGACGKTCFLEVYKSGVFPEDYVPTIVDNFVMRETVNNHEVVLTLWDTSGQDEYDALRPLSYSNANLIIICYSIERREMLENIEEKWLTEIQNLCKNVPYFLVGLKEDIREAASPAQAASYVSTEEGAALAQKIGAKHFVECSALTRKNIKETFAEIAQYVVKHKAETKSGGGFKLFWCC